MLQPEVSVLCITYNHINYINECLDSLLNQKTTFPYQIIVHDDASNDGTAELILKYHKKYPEIIIPILQKKNLYSQGISPVSFIESKLSGKYIAMCEGDDWWTDESKLQIQYDYLESHPECSVCVHDVAKFSDANKAWFGLMPISGNERDVSVDEVLANGGGYIGTNSLFYRIEYYELPAVFSGWGIGDYPRQIYLSSVGKMHYIPKLMSAYRFQAKGSWTERVTSDRNRTIEANLKISEGLYNYNQATHGAHQEAVDVALASLTLESLSAGRNWKDILNPKIRDYYKSLSTSKKMRLWLRCFAPDSVLRIIETITVMLKIVKHKQNICR